MRFGSPFVPVILVTYASCLVAQSAPPAAGLPAPAASQSTAAAGGRWDEISDRVVFLTRTLATVEASLTAIDQQIRHTGYKAASKQDAARNAAKGNELMNRNLGMPMSIDWKDFYGRTAQRFFYHPRDGNTFYINPHPIADRPPQFDFIYKANQQAMRQAQTDAAALGGKVDALLRRKDELEHRQLALWAQIPFEAVAYQEVTSKPLYRFELKAPSKQTLDQQHLAAVSAGARFVRDLSDLMAQTSNMITRDPGGAIRSLDERTAASVKRLQDALLKQDLLASRLTVTDDPLEQLAAAAKRTAAIARNLSDAWQLVSDSSSAGDDPAKQQYRAVMQNSLLDYASMVMVGDESVQKLAHDWNIAVDTSRELSDEQATQQPLRSQQPEQQQGATAFDTTRLPPATIPADAVAFNGHHYKYFAESIDWNEADQRCKEMGGFLAWPPADGTVKFLNQLKGGKGSAAWLSGYKTKEGWQTVADGHPIHKSRLHVKPGDQAIVLSGDGHLDGRPFSGEEPAAKVKKVTGFICQWDQ